MTTNGFITQVQSLRELIATNHGYDPWTAATTAGADRKAIAKLQMYMGEIFSKKERDKRINTIGILIGRKITSTLGRQGLTVGELYALLTWCSWDEAYFPLPDPDVENVLLKLRDNPQKWVPVINQNLGPMSVPIAVRYEDGQAEATPF